MKHIRQWFRKASAAEEFAVNSPSRQEMLPANDLQPPAKTLAQRVAETHAFFDPKNLADLILQYNGEVALLVIDVQKQFCDPDDWMGNGSEETVQVSERVKDLTPAFRKAGIPVYAVHFGKPEKDASAIDFYKFIPEPGDTLVAKNMRSAFLGGNIREILDRDHRKLLLTCGVYLNQCVRETVEDAVDQGFDVCLLRDMTGDYKGDADNTDQNLTAMTRKGIAVLQSGQVLEALKIAKRTASAPGI